MKKGFTLLELLLVVAIIAILAVVVFSVIVDAVAKSRDTTRLADANQIQSAIDQYLIDNENFPSNADNDYGGWDCNFDSSDPGGFINDLETGGYMATPFDPSTSISSCATGGMRYHRYSAGAYGCDATKGSFYVLIIDDLELTTGTHEDSIGWSCPSRNWQNEGEWVIGKFQYPTR